MAGGLTRLLIEGWAKEPATCPTCATSSLQPNLLHALCLRMPAKGFVKGVQHALAGFMDCENQGVGKAGFVVAIDFTGAFDQ